MTLKRERTGNHTGKKKSFVKRPSTYRNLWLISIVLFFTSFIFVFSEDYDISTVIMLLSLFTGFTSFIVWIALLIYKKSKRLLKIILIGTVSLILIYAFFFESKKITGHSMEPTLMDNEYVLMEKLSYFFKAPSREDLIIFVADEGNEYVGRVIGLPNEHILIKESKVYLNGSLYQETNVDWSEYESEEPTSIMLKENEYYMMLDRRNQYSKITSTNRIQGRLYFSYFPLSKWGFVNK